MKHIRCGIIAICGLMFLAACCPAPQPPEKRPVTMLVDGTEFRLTVDGANTRVIIPVHSYSHISVLIDTNATVTFGAYGKGVADTIKTVYIDGARWRPQSKR